MNSQTARTQDSLSIDETEVRALYRDLLEGWNKRDAHAFAALFAEDGESIGFDGSQVVGRVEIETHLLQIFADHVTGSYVGKVRDVSLLSPDVALLRADAGMVPPGRTDLEPALNAVQTLVATKHEGGWRAVLYQNTPAQFHGRPEMVREMTEELSRLLR